MRHGNEPFGALVVKNREIAAETEYQIYTGHDFTRHAELGLLQKFTAETGITDLSEYTLYSSCEPCFMCSGASDADLCTMLHETGGECRKTVSDRSHHKPSVTAGVLREESLAVLREYFLKNKKN